MGILKFKVSKWKYATQCRDGAGTRGREGREGREGEREGEREYQLNQQLMWYWAHFCVGVFDDDEAPGVEPSMRVSMSR